MSEQTVFMFNASSADKPPGSGVMEKIAIHDKKHNIYSGLKKITNWRKMLSNEFMAGNNKLGMNELIIDEQKWASVEHYLLSCHIKKKCTKDYEKLMIDGEYGNETISNIKTILKVKKYDYSNEDLQKALLAKFNLENNPQMCKVLTFTKDAILTSWKRGMQCELDTDGNKIAKSCDLTQKLMEIRTILLSRCNEEFLDEKNDKANSTTKNDYKKKNEPSSSNIQEEDQVNDSHRDKSNEVKRIMDTNIQSEIKILSKKEIDNYNDFISKYDPINNKSNNILTIYEKTNILGVRMEQLALGADSYLDNDKAIKLGNVKEIAMQEFIEKKIPFIICRVLPDNSKEYWKFEHMVTNNCYT